MKTTAQEHAYFAHSVQEGVCKTGNVGSKAKQPRNCGPPALTREKARESTEDPAASFQLNTRPTTTRTNAQCQQVPRPSFHSYTTSLRCAAAVGHQPHKLATDDDNRVSRDYRRRVYDEGSRVQG